MSYLKSLINIHTLISALAGIAATLVIGLTGASALDRSFEAQDAIAIEGRLESKGYVRQDISEAEYQASDKARQAAENNAKLKQLMASAKGADDE